MLYVVALWWFMVPNDDIFSETDASVSSQSASQHLLEEFSWPFAMIATKGPESQCSFLRMTLFILKLLGVSPRTFKQRGACLCTAVTTICFTGLYLLHQSTYAKMFFFPGLFDLYLAVSLLTRFLKDKHVDFLFLRVFKWLWLSSGYVEFQLSGFFIGTSDVFLLLIFLKTTLDAGFVTNISSLANQKGHQKDKLGPGLVFLSLLGLLSGSAYLNFANRFSLLINMPAANYFVNVLSKDQNSIFFLEVLFMISWTWFGLFLATSVVFVVSVILSLKQEIKLQASELRQIVRSLAVYRGKILSEWYRKYQSLLYLVDNLNCKMNLYLGAVIMFSAFDIMLMVYINKVHCFPDGTTVAWVLQHLIQILAIMASAVSFNHQASSALFLLFLSQPVWCHNTIAFHPPVHLCLTSSFCSRLQK